MPRCWKNLDLYIEIDVGKGMHIDYPLLPVSHRELIPISYSPLPPQILLSPYLPLQSMDRNPWF